METTHKGRIALDEGGRLDVDLHLSSTRLFIESGSAEIGSWPLHQCLIEQSDDGSFTLVVDEDMVDFTPDHPSVFTAAVDEFFGDKPRRLDTLTSRLNGGSSTADHTDLESMAEALDDLPLSPPEPPAPEPPARELKPVRVSATDQGEEEGWVSEDILESQRALRSSTSVKKLTPQLLKKVAIVAGVILVVAVAAWGTPRVLASVDLGSLFSSEPAPTTVASSTTTTTVQTTTTTVAEATATSEVTETTSPAAGGVFAFSSNEFVDSWNEIGGPISPALRFPAYLAAGEFEQNFSSYLRMTGLVSDTGRLEAFTLTVDPTGPSNSDVLGINALGVAIAVVEPELDGNGRKAVLASLGLNVEKPSLEGIDREVTRSGLVYELVYDSEAVLLNLTVTPAG